MKNYEHTIFNLYLRLLTTCLFMCTTRISIFFWFDQVAGPNDNGRSSIAYRNNCNQ
jgi:hypothetical protein